MSNLVATQFAAGSPSVEQFEQHYRTMYTAQSSMYDQIRFSRPAGQTFNTSEQSTISRLLELHPGQTLLDVAAGTGRIATHLASQGAEVFAYDLTPNMLRQARARATAAEITNLHYINGNGRQLPFGDNQFDAVMSIRFLHLFPVKLYRPFVQEMWRVLRPGGVLLIQFDSALAGAGMGWAREAYYRRRFGTSAPYLLRPGQVADIFQDIGPISIHGSSVFAGRFIRQIHPGFATWLELLLSEGPQSFLANRVFVRAIKR